MALVLTYKYLQDAAGTMQKSGQDIPQRLVEFIHQLAPKRTGMAGLTVHEGFVSTLDPDRAK